MAKITKFLTMLIFIFMGTGFINISEDSIFFAEKIWLCQRSKF